MISRSHRSRLTVGAAVLFGGFLGIFFAMFAWLFHQLEGNAADDALNRTLSYIASASTKKEEILDLQRAIQGQRGVSVAIFDSDGNLINSVGNVTIDQVNGSGVMTMDNERVRYRSRKVLDQTVVAVISWDGAERNERRLTWMLVFIWPPLTGIVAWVAWTAVGRTFRPLLGLAEEASRLSGSDLSNRLPEPEDKEFGELAKQLNAFLVRLETGVRSQERFITDAAHELRTPLTILRGQIETALMRDRTGAEYRRVLGLLLEEQMRMSEIVETLLISARTAATVAGKISADKAVVDVTDRMRSQFVAKGVSLEVSVDKVKTRMLRTELESVLTNLLSNALRYSGSGTICKVQLVSSGGKGCLTVSDQGPGVAEAIRERIFDRFFRDDASRSRETGGYGIGLSVCHRIITERHGSIQVVDNESRGAKFIVQLPA